MRYCGYVAVALVFIWAVAVNAQQSEVDIPDTPAVWPRMNTAIAASL